MPMERQYPPAQTDPDGTFDSRYAPLDDYADHVSANVAHGADGPIVGGNTLSTVSAILTTALNTHVNATTTHGSDGPIVGQETLDAAIGDVDAAAQQAQQDIDDHAADTTIHHTLGYGSTDAAPGDHHRSPLSGEWFTTTSHGCYGTVGTMSLAANILHIIPLDLDVREIALDSVVFQIAAVGTATECAVGIYDSSLNLVFSVTDTNMVVDTKQYICNGEIAAGPIPNRVYVVILTNGTLTVSSCTAVRNMLRMVEGILGSFGRMTRARTYADGLPSTLTISGTAAQTATPLVGVQAQ